MSMTRLLEELQQGLEAAGIKVLRLPALAADGLFRGRSPLARWAPTSHMSMTSCCSLSTGP
eukprot:4245170-Alexandrium_andersonii.AAC.1